MTDSKHIRTRVLTSAAIVIASTSFTFVGLYISQRHPSKNPIATISPKLQFDAPIAESTGHVYSLPSRLVIPKLNIDASILPMGVTASGAMESPATDNDTGWYSQGARPGNVGSAVIAGHLGLGYEAVFGKLHLLTAGDTFSVIDNQGMTASFIVRDIREYDRNSDTTEIFNGNDEAFLNLITCNGDWESTKATYSKRLVVFSEKIDHL